MTLAAFGVGQVLFSLLYFFLFFIWIMLLFRVFGDVIGDRELSGVAKVGWLIFVVVLPYLGVFTYLILRGNKMAENEHRRVVAQEEAVRGYIQNAAGTAESPAAELTRLAALRDQGVIDEAEFAKLKAKVIG